ncbi:MAG TPA: S-layer homology domain-containing protein [Candidatus Ornithomonoglobus intestinigallinarum]|uniref:S-layer homology domain-containing protein n=1 Tax=Candidatus Ornithomonoglobus intestinigallinarum TaxID=2840894 RepID=A0A9D1KRG3_9FIRM|nr:S-layer homology domain-containing protein [Candidatus Ornithomonoglobus intestinigallinarum]
MKKQIIAAAAALAISFSAAAYAAEFNDIKGHWAENTINRIADLGIVNGVSEHEFDPDGAVTRAEYLKMIMELTDIETVTPREGECLDGEGTWYAPYLQSALDKGLIPKEMIASYRADINVTTDESGNTMSSVVYRGAFNGELQVDREEMAVLTMHMYQYASDSAGMLNTQGSVSFTDTDSISVWAQPSVRLAVSVGFIEGMGDGSFQPMNTATRAQAATIIGRILDRQALMQQ